ncbi:LysR substrate binding domain protein [Streptomyces sp. MA5143a]|nr:LysR substrate binding domain protein [Streptomyces sp. MA5143a]
MTATTLLNEPLDVALPRGHVLVSKPLLTPRDVADQPWITVHDGFPLMSIIEAIASVANRRLDIVHRINEFAVVAEAVAASGCLALMPRWTARPHPDVALKPLGGVHARRDIDVLHRPERTARKAVRTVLAELHRAAARIQDRDRCVAPTATGPLAHVEERTTMTVTRPPPPGWIGGTARGPCGIAVVIVELDRFRFSSGRAQGAGYLTRAAPGSAAAHDRRGAGELTWREPRHLRLLSAAVQIVTTARRWHLRFARNWPWTDVITDALARLEALPNPC